MALTGRRERAIMRFANCHFFVVLLILAWETMEPYTLLVISRTQSLAKRLRSMLDGEQYLVRWVPSTTQALNLDVCPSLAILDLPPSGGSRSVARIKQQFAAPLLALARSEQAIPSQVDVSLSRPYRLHHLVELIEVTLVDHSPHRIRAGRMTLDRETRRLQMNGEIFQLRPIGCEILALLMGQAGDVVPRDELFQRVWRTEDGDTTRALDVHVSHLRRQIEVDPHNPAVILTERGVGYRLEPPA
jgi:DNA-binding response OmpR family regulator